MQTAVGPRNATRRALMKLSLALALMLTVLVTLNAPTTFASTGNGATAAITANAQSTTDETAADVAAKANPATVTVINLQAMQTSNNSTSTQQVPVGSGSGYIIDEAGHVVTNNHVVEGGTTFQVTLMDGTTLDATLVGTDAYQDVAVLQLDLAKGTKVPGTLAFGDSSTVRAGDEVIAIGTPFGEYANSVTVGTVNAVDRSLATDNAYDLPNLIQHDAAIYPGNSGGPLLNLNGDVIGMNVAKAVDPTLNSQSDTSIGFAIESNAIKDLVQEIIDTGHVARPYLGIRTQVTADGQTIMSIEDGGPAATAGLQQGDIITALDGHAITDQNPFINQLIFGHKPGDDVTLTVERNGSDVSVKVTLGERPLETQ